MTIFLAGVFVGTAIGVIIAALCAAAGDSESMSDALHADLVALERAEQSSIVAAVAWRRRALEAEADLARYLDHHMTMKEGGQ